MEMIGDKKRDCEILSMLQMDTRLLGIAKSSEGGDHKCNCSTNVHERLVNVQSVLIEGHIARLPADGQLRSVCLICPPPTPCLHSASLFVPVLAPLDLLVCYKYWLLSHIPHTLAFHLLIHDDHVTKEPTVAGAFTDAGLVAQRSVADTPQYRTDA